MQTQSARLETNALSTLSRVDAIIANGGKSGKKTALETLSNFLDKNIKSHNPAIDKVFDKVIELATEAEMISYIQRAIRSQTIRVAALSSHHLRDAMNTVLDAGKSIVMRAASKMEDAHQKNTVEEAIFLNMTGMSHDERGKQRFIDPAFATYMDIVKPCLLAIEKNSKFEQLYQEIVRTALGLCKQFDRTYEMNFLNKILRDHANAIFNCQDNRETRQRETQRDNVVDSAETISAMISTKQEQTRIAGECRDWKGAVDIMREFRSLIANLVKLKKTTKNSDMCPVWELEAEVLFNAGNMPFHANHAVMVAKKRIFHLGVEDDAVAKTMASQAVLAVLCVPDKQLSSSDEGSERLLHLSKTLQMVAPPTREGLLADLERPVHAVTSNSTTSLLAIAHPFVRELYNLLVSVPTIEVCKIAAPLLKQISQQSPGLARYVDALEAVAVRNMLGIMSRCFSAVGIDDFIRRCGGLFKEDGSDFAPRVEPLLLKESFGNKTNIVVDFGTRQIIFLPSVVSAENLISFQSTFAAHVAEVTREAYSGLEAKKPAAAPVETSAKETKKKAKELMSKIEDSRIRTLARHVICKQRVDNFQERIKQLQIAEERRRQEAIDQRAAMEEAKRLAARKKADEKMNKIIEEEEALERRKWVVTQVNTKHKTAHVPPTLANKPDSEFLPEASKILLKTMRAAENSRASDTKTMEYYERFAREIEAPKRHQFFKDQAEEQAKTLKLNAENRKKERVRAHEEQLVMKQKLTRLMAQKKAYEKSVKDSFERAKKAATGDKRQVEEDDLAKMMAEREAAAAAARK